MKLRLKKIIVITFCLLFLNGVIFSGYADIICIGEDGHFELETICLTSCTETETQSEQNGSLNISDSQHTQHEKHNDCSNCSDVEVDNHLWSKRTSRVDFNKLLKSSYAPLVNSLSALTKPVHKNILSSDFDHLYSLSPPILYTKPTVLRC